MSGIMVDKDHGAAFSFLRDVIYSKVRESEKPGSCFHDVDKRIDSVGRPIDRHKKLGDFD